MNAFKVGDLVECYWIEKDAPNSITGIITSIKKSVMIKLDSCDNWYHMSQCKRIVYEGDIDVNKGINDIIKAAKDISKNQKIHDSIKEDFSEIRNEIEQYKIDIERTCREIDFDFSSSVDRCEKIYQEVLSLRNTLVDIIGGGVVITSSNIVSHLEFILRPFYEKISQLESKIRLKDKE